MIELGRDTLHGGQGLTSITLCVCTSVSLQPRRSGVGCGVAIRPSRDSGVWYREKHTLDADMDVLLGLSSLSRVLVGFGEGVYAKQSSQRLGRVSGLNPRWESLQSWREQKQFCPAKTNKSINKVASATPLQSQKQRATRSRKERAIKTYRGS